MSSSAHPFHKVDGGIILSRLCPAFGCPAWTYFIISLSSLQIFHGVVTVLVTFSCGPCAEHVEVLQSRDQTCVTPVTQAASGQHWIFNTLHHQGTPVLVIFKTLFVKKLGVPWWLFGLRTWHCHCCGSGCHFVSDSLPNSGTSACHSWCKKNFFYCYIVFIAISLNDCINFHELIYHSLLLCC